MAVIVTAGLEIEDGRAEAGKRRRGRALRHALLVSTALVWAAPAFAQQQNVPASAAPASEQGAGTQLEAITAEGRGETAKGPVNGFVATRSATATKTDTPLIDTPQSIAVIGQDQIQLQKAQSLSEAVRYVPGIFAESFGANNRLDFYYIRGFKADDTGLYRDGLQLFSTGYANFRTEPFGLDRIEVLRGPSSVLFGGSAPGGLINLVTKRPTEDPLHYIEFGAGSYGQTYTQFDLSGPATPKGDILYRFTGVGRVGGTQVDYAKDDRLYLAPSFTYRPDGATTFTVLTSYQQDYSNSVGFFLPYYGTVRPTQIGTGYGRIPTNLFLSDRGVDGFHRRQALLGYEFEHKFDSIWTFRQNFRFDYLDVQDHRVYGNGYADAAQSQFSRFNFLANSRVGLVTVDNQAEARFGTGPLEHVLLTGVDYKHYDLAQTNGFSVAPNFNFAAPQTFQTISPAVPYLVNHLTMDQVGFYAQDQVRLGKFVLTLSGRQDFVNTQVLNGLTSAGTERENRAFSGRAALLYESEIGVSPYVSYSTFFNPIPNTDANGTLFKPETGNQVEVGAKYQPTDFPAFFTVSAFDLRRQNVQVVDPNNIFNQIQTGEIRSTGVEFQAVANPIPGLNLVGAYTKFDLRNTKVTDLTTLDKLPVNVPEETASLFADYTLQDGILKGFGLGGGIRYVGRSFADTINTYRVPDYTLFDAVAHYERDGWRLAVNVQNLGDRTFVASCSTVNACFYGDRRRITGSISYRW